MTTKKATKPAPQATGRKAAPKKVTRLRPGAETASLIEGHKTRAGQLKKRIRAAKKELRVVRKQLKAAKKEARQRLKAVRAGAKKRLAGIAALARRKRVQLAEAIAPTPELEQVEPKKASVRMSPVRKLQVKPEAKPRTKTKTIGGANAGKPSIEAASLARVARAPIGATPPRKAVARMEAASPVPPAPVTTARETPPTRTN